MREKLIKDLPFILLTMQARLDAFLALINNFGNFDMGPGFLNLYEIRGYEPLHFNFALILLGIPLDNSKIKEMSDPSFVCWDFLYEKWEETEKTEEGLLEFIEFVTSSTPALF